MKIIHKKINFKDGRGTITDIFINEPKDHATVIFSKKGSTRGDHYHKKSTQYTFVVAGQLLMLTRLIGKKRVYKHLLNPNDLMIHRPGEIHTLIAKKDTIFLAFADGLRGGKNYEKDTYHLEVSLAKSV